MTAKRPTRDEAAIAFTGLSWRALTQPQRGGLDAVAALFGGFAEEPAKVPRLGDVEADPTSAMIGLLLERPVMTAIYARSNAWTDIREALHQVLLTIERGERHAHAQLHAVFDQMSAPEMGRGPGGGE